MIKALKIAMAFAALAVCGRAWLRTDPGLIYLAPHGAASWIVLSRPSDPAGYAPDEMSAVFRKRFVLDAAATGEISMSALATAHMSLDGLPALKSEDPRAWKRPQRGIFSLAVGAHEISVVARRTAGPPALRLRADAFGLATGPDWQASADGRTWTAAASAAEYRPMAFSRGFGSGLSHLRRCAPYLAFVFMVVFVWSLSGKWRLSAAQTRWVLLGSWVVLAANNIRKLPLISGFDVPGHMAYAWYIIQHWKLPAPNQGWEMFQAPLYYLILAPLYAVSAKLLSPAGALQAVRVVGLLCGAAQIELAFRATRRVYPGREDLQVLGTILGGLLPINIYLSQTAGNEPLAGVLCSALIVAAWRLTSGKKTEAPSKALLVLGALLGLAVLTKVSSLLLALPLAAFLALTLPESEGSSRGQSLGVVFVAAAAVCGWYFARNWLVTGAPFVSGWDPARGFDFWQEPGYRTARDLLTWGQSLHYPIYSAGAGFWDSIYSTLWLDGFLGGALKPSAFPRWNMSPLIASAWLAILPTAAILLGLRSAADDEPRRKYILFSAACLGLYLTALLVVFLRHPFYSTAKAGYTLGLVPCYAALACAGFERLTTGAYARAAVYAGMACWAVTAYAAYFAL